MMYERTVDGFVAAFNRRSLIAALRAENSVAAIFDVIPNPTKISLPLFADKVPAGFPDATSDHRRECIDLHTYLIREADASFYIRVGGDSMIDAGILPDDIAVVDRSITANFGDSIVGVIYNEFTIKTLSRDFFGNPVLKPANSTAKYPTIHIKEEMGFEVWGVVTGTVRKFIR